MSRGYLYIGNEQVLAVQHEGENINNEDILINENGIYTFSQGYTGLGTVDVGVGQVGVGYQALNLTGNDISQNDKVWLNYRGPISTSRIVGAGTWYGLYPPFCTIDGDYVIYDRSYNGSGWNFNRVTDTTDTLISTFTWWNRDYDKIAYYTLDTYTLIVFGGSFNGSTASTKTLSLDASGNLLNTGVRRELGYGFYINTGVLSNPTIYDSDNNEYTYPDTWWGRPYCVFKKNDNFYLLTTHYGQSSSSRVVYICSINTTAHTISYYKQATGGSRLDYFSGVTEDGKYAFFQNAILDIDNQTFVTSINGTSFEGWTFRNPYNPISKVITGSYGNSSNYTCDHKIWAYDSNNNKFKDITSDYVLEQINNYGTACVNITGINRDRAFYHISNTSNSGRVGVTFKQIADTYTIMNYNGVSSNSLTGFAAENILAGATGIVIVGTGAVNTPLAIIPSTSAQSFIPDASYGYGPVTVSAVTSSIDANISANNIRNGVQILGVTGNLIEGIIPTGTLPITTNNTYDVTNYASVEVNVSNPTPSGNYQLLDRIEDDNHNEIGTVSGFFTDANNIEYAVVCLDASYRLAAAAWCSDANTLIANLPAYNNHVSAFWYNATETATENTQTI